jgi:hypothetical protein
MRQGPDMRKMVLTQKAANRRRRVKINRHDPVNRGRPIYWCGYCEKYSHSLTTHQCGKRQA